MCTREGVKTGGREGGRERESDRERESERHREAERQREKQRERERERDRERERGRARGGQNESAHKLEQTKLVERLLAEIAGDLYGVTESGSFF